MSENLFGHIHRHGEFSRLDAVGTAKQYAERAKELGQGFLTQTDHGTLSGALHHIAACRKAGIVPIVGVEAYYRPDRFSRDTRSAWHLILLAKNLRGWRNLLRICSIAYADPGDGGGFYQYPCLDDDLLDTYSEGLIASSACFQSWLASLIRNGDSSAAREYISAMRRRFGDDFWLEIMPHDFDDQRVLNVEITRLADEYSVGLIATNDVHFVYPEWAETQRIAKMMSTNLSFEKLKKMDEKGEEPPYMAELCPTIYLCSDDEMYEWFRKNHPNLSQSVVSEAIDNTYEIAKCIKPFLLDTTTKMPKVTETPLEAEQILSEWVEEGLNRISDEYPIEHWEKYDFTDYTGRIEFEWEILKNKGAIPYMVMVGDICRWCRSQGIRLGLGRGSAAGCLISYLAGITAIDPIPWGLLFERFLNPDRKGMPDIDIDVQSDRRAEVKAYIVGKYGADHVADIITHERFQPKSVIQSLCRVYDINYVEAQRVTDTIDIRQDDEETTLEELLPINEDLRIFKSKYPEIWEHALRLDQTVRNVGKHAGGVVITPKPIVEYMALERGKKGDLVTSWSDSADFMVISDNGFQKLDLLGIQGLTRHEYCCRLILKRHGKKIDLDKLSPLRDPYDCEQEVLDVFTNRQTIGIFQFGSKGISDLIHQIRPDNALDITAANALYRPGAMGGGATWDYARYKNGEKEVDYWHPLVEPILKETYGIIAYQEQVMEIAKRLGGFTPAQADDLRKAMGKLYRIKGGSAAKEFMRRYDELWDKGTAERGIARDVAELIKVRYQKFGHYGFNKSHSGSYSCRAYQDAWLKVHYPLEFYASILTHPSGGTPKAKQEFMSRAIREAKGRGIRILPPDVNVSELGWTIDGKTLETGPKGDALRFGLLSIKDVGDVAAAQVILRRAFQPYKSLLDFQQRCPKRSVNKKVVDALVESGAFDFCGARSEASGAQIIAWERDRLKFVVTASEATGRYQQLIRDNIFTQNEVEDAPKGTDVIIGGEITNVNNKTAKNGNPYANVTIVFEENTWTAKFWQNKLALFGDMLKEGNTVMINGRKDEWQGYTSVSVDLVTEVETLAKQLEEEAA